MNNRMPPLPSLPVLDLHGLHKEESLKLIKLALTEYENYSENIRQLDLNEIVDDYERARGDYERARAFHIAFGVLQGLNWCYTLMSRQDVTEGKSPTSVLQKWVTDQSKAIQGTLLTGVRGPDGCSKWDDAKRVVQAFRFTFMNNAHTGNKCEDCSGIGYLGPIANEVICNICDGDPDRMFPKDGDTFMGDWSGIPEHDSGAKLLKNHDHYPHHWLMHLIHCSEIIGYLHPNDKIQRWWHDFYLKWCNTFHMIAESKDEMLSRLKERE